MQGRPSPASINQAPAAVKLLYAQSGLRVDVKPSRPPKPSEPDALTPLSRAGWSGPPRCL
ncbi:hypothetical protein AB0K48_23500 [Nonomuraea sp. NPDC055795]